MKELKGKLSKGITLVYGDHYIGKSTVIYEAIHTYSANAKVCLISDNPDIDLLTYPDNVLIASAKGYDELNNLFNSVFLILPRVVAIDTITEIYRRENADIKGLSRILSRLSNTDIPVILSADTYKNFDTNEEVLLAKDTLIYYSETVIKLGKEKGVFKATKQLPIKELAYFSIKAPNRTVVLK